MSLSKNIKRLRTEKKLTQEQLAAALGVSSQAVSKWENNDTYPDGSLLVPLAKLFEVSLDELFDNDSVYMADTARRIMKILAVSKNSEQFNVARDICWQIEKGMFNRAIHSEDKYDPDDAQKRHNNASCVLSDYGFTVVSNGAEPFFALVPESEAGFGEFIKNKEFIGKVFMALSCEHTMSAILYLYRKNQNYVFEGTVLERECNIPDDKLSEVIDGLLTLRIIWKQELSINGVQRTLYYSQPNHALIALFLMAEHLGYRGAFCLNINNRSKPFLP